MFRRLILLISLTLPHAGTAHEFWISPERYEVASGAPIVAELRVGENLKGSGYPYVPRRAARFDVVFGDQTIRADSRAGDRPALAMPIEGDGLAIVVHETTDSTLKYRAWEKFVAFAEHKDFVFALDVHRDRGLPETDFTESYRRYAKALVAVGTGKGQDRPVGLETEIVALANPYTDDLQSGLPVQVLYKARPRANAQVELFAKAPDGTVDVTLHRTDEAGKVTLPMTAGFEYLVDAVIIEAVEPTEDSQAVWHTLWAALTFRTPD